MIPQAFFSRQERRRGEEKKDDDEEYEREEGMGRGEEEPMISRLFPSLSASRPRYWSEGEIGWCYQVAGVEHRGTTLHHFVRPVT